MRDFYDIYVLTMTQTFDESTFRAALDKTAEKRHTAKQMSYGIADTIDRISKNETMANLWQKYQKNYFYATDISWDKVINAVYALADKTKRL